MAVWTTEQKNQFREEHALIMPEHQFNHNLPHADVKKYFDTIFATDFPEYKGMVTIAGLYKNASAPQIVAVVPADKLGDWASKMHVSTKMDYYYGKAQHCGNATWGTEGVFAYNTIGVDIDAHSGVAHENNQSVIDAVIYALADKNIPEPNIIENSGRGYHLVWLLEQMSARFGQIAREVASHYAEVVKSILKEYAITNYTVDDRYSANIAGLTRIPGTFNTKSGSYATYALRHAVRVDLAKAYDTISAHIRPVRSKKRSNHDWAQRRLDALLCYAKLNPSMQERRDKFCLILFSTAQATGMSNDEAMILVQNTNSSFREPLTARELETFLRTASRKHYKFSNETIISYLDLSEDEQQVLNLHKAIKRDSNRVRNERRAEKRAKRNKAIMRLFLVGKTVTEIARKMGYAYNTVRAVVRRYGSNLEELFASGELRRLRRERIKELVNILRSTREASVSDSTLFKNGSNNKYAYTENDAGQLIIELEPFSASRHPALYQASLAKRRRRQALPNNILKGETV